MSYNKLKALTANVEAIETAMKIQVQGRQATAEEKEILSRYSGFGGLIERFKVMKIEQDPNQKDRVLLDIHITPYFPAKSFVIQLAGHKGDNPEDAIWESEYHQE